MNAPAAIALRRQGAPDLLIGYADAVAAMPVNPDARRIRRNAAARLLEMYPHLREWLSRQTAARLADLKRTGGWPFLSWCLGQHPCQVHRIRHAGVEALSAERGMHVCGVASQKHATLPDAACLAMSVNREIQTGLCAP